MHDFEKVAQKFFNNKDISDNKQVSKILDCFDDHWITNWAEVDHEWLMKMIFPAFMTELCHLYLQPLWEEMTHAKFLGLSQSTSSFWEFVVLVQKTNSLLKGTPSHKDPHAVCEHIERGMDQVLFKRCVEEKADKILHDGKSEELRLWMDDKMRSYHKNTVWELEAQSHAQKHLQPSRDNHLTDPSRCANTFPSNCPTSSSSTPNGKCSYLHNLTDAEWTLLRDNKSCFKCHHPFAGHCTFKGKCDALNGNNYLPVTQATINAAKKAHHICLNNHVAAISITQNEPLSSSALNQVCTRSQLLCQALQILLLTMLPTRQLFWMGQMILMTKWVLCSQISLLPSSKVSRLLQIPPSTWISQGDLTVNCPPPILESLSLPPISLPLSFDCLLDNGSHLNLICDSWVNQLRLHKKKLKTPIEMNLTMHLNENKTSSTFYNFIRLPLYDVAGGYRAKSVYVEPLLPSSSWTTFLVA